MREQVNEKLKEGVPDRGTHLHQAWRLGGLDTAEKLSLRRKREVSHPTAMAIQKENRDSSAGTGTPAGRPVGSKFKGAGESADLNPQSSLFYC